MQRSSDVSIILSLYPAYQYHNVPITPRPRPPLADNPTEDLEHLEKLRQKTLQEIDMLSRQRSKLTAQLQQVQEEADGQSRVVKEAHHEYSVVAKVVDKIRKHLALLRQRDTSLESILSAARKRLWMPQGSTAG